MDRDFGMEAQAAAETHLAACFATLFAEEEGADEVPESPASAPFCGCETCLVREALVGAWKVVDAYCDDATKGLAVALEGFVSLWPLLAHGPQVQAARGVLDAHHARGT